MDERTKELQERLDRVKKWNDEWTARAFSELTKRGIYQILFSISLLANIYLLLSIAIFLRQK